MAGSRSEPGGNMAAPPEAPGIGCVLGPLDGSRPAEAAIPVAAEEARLRGVPLVLLRVVPCPEPPTGDHHFARGAATNAAPRPDVAAAVDEARVYLAAVIVRFGLAAEPVVRAGDPFHQIAAEADRRPSPLVVMTGHATAIHPAGFHSELARRLVATGRFHVLLVPAARET